MQRLSTIVLQAVIVLIGIAVFAGLVWEPQLEGVNAHATQLEIYFQDPFLAYVYLGSIPFFVALYWAFTVLRYVRHDKIFSQAAVKAVRTIRYCAFMTAGAIVGADALLILFATGEDDAAGVMALSLVAIVTSIVIGTAAAVFEGILQSAIDRQRR